MPIGLTIYKEDNPHEVGFKKGDVTSVLESIPNDVWNSPKTCLLILTDTDNVDQAKAIFTPSWERQINLQATWFPAQKGYRASINASQVSTSGGGKVKPEQVRNFLTNWGCSIVSSGDNIVTFDAVLFDVIKSAGFLGMSVSGVTWTEISFVNNTMRIMLDWTGKSWDAQQIREALEDRGGIFVSYGEKTITMDFPRTIINGRFKEKLEEQVSELIFRCRYYFSSNAVDAIIANGNTMETTKAQAQSYLRDRLTE